MNDNMQVNRPQPPSSIPRLTGKQKGGLIAATATGAIFVLAGGAAAALFATGTGSHLASQISMIAASSAGFVVLVGAGGTYVIVRKKDAPHVAVPQANPENRKDLSTQPSPIDNSDPPSREQTPTPPIQVNEHEAPPPAPSNPSILSTFPQLNVVEVPNVPYFRAREQSAQIVRARDVQRIDFEGIAIREGVHPNLPSLMMRQVLEPIRLLPVAPNPCADDPRRSRLQELTQKERLSEIKASPESVFRSRPTLNITNLPLVEEPSELSRSWVEVKTTNRSVELTLKSEQERLQLADNYIPLLGLLWSKLAHGNVTIKDNDLIIINGDWIQSRDRVRVEDLNALKNSVGIFRFLLQETFGMPLADTIIKRYKLHKCDNLTWGLLKDCIQGIAANVKSEDLKDLFKILKKQPCNNIMHCFSSLNPEQIDAIIAYDHFEQLPPEAFEILLLPFRTLAVGNERVPILDVFYPYRKGNPLSLPPIIPNTSSGCDLEILLALDQITDLWNKSLDVPALKENAAAHHLFLSEYNAKILSYLRLKHGMVIPLLNDKGSKVYYTINTIFKDFRDGVIPHTFVPINSFQGTCNVYYNMRGTESRGGGYSNWQTLIRDAGSVAPHGGVGFPERIARKEDLRYLANKLLVNPTWDQQKRIVYASGHSLGGADIQGVSVIILEEICNLIKAGRHEALKDIELRVVAHNPPGCTHEENNKFIEYMKFIKKAKDEGKITNFNIDISLIFFNYKKGVLEGQDIVPWAGPIYLSSFCDDRDFASMINRRIIYCDRPGLTNLQAHTSLGFAGDFEVKILEESNPEQKDEVKQVFQKKYYVDKSYAGLVRWAADSMTTPIRSMNGWIFNQFIYGIVNGYDHYRHRNGQLTSNNNPHDPTAH